MRQRRPKRENGLVRLGVLAVLAILLGGGCYFLRYEALMRTHVDLMVAMAEKRHDLRDLGESVGNPAEYRYPLERARDFARIVGDRFGERVSYRRFVGFVDRYEALLDAADVESLSAGLDALRGDRDAIFAALEVE